MENLDELILKCPVCGKDSYRIIHDREEFFCVVNESVQWSDFVDKVSELKEQDWRRSNNVPQQGEMRTVFVEFPFNYCIGEQFHAKYCSALTFYNGVDTVEDIENTAIVECRFLYVIAKNENSAWIKINVENVMMIPEILKSINTIEGNKQYEDIVSKCTDEEEYGSWKIYSWSAQGDLGEWMLIYEDENAIKHIILYSFWDFHINHVYCGNVLL